VVVPRAASIVARQKWSPPWRQVGLGLVGTMVLPSAVGWLLPSLACGARCLLVTCDCCRLLVSHHGEKVLQQVPPPSTRHSGEVYSAKVDSCVLLVFFVSAETGRIPAHTMITLALREEGICISLGLLRLDRIYYCC